MSAKHPPKTPPTKTEQLNMLANRLHVSMHDVAEARRFAETAKMLRDKPDSPPGMGPLVESDIESALEISAIVSYARAFRDSRSNGAADKKLDPDALDMFKGHPTLEVEHKRCLALRDQVVAHSDWEHRSSIESRTPDGKIWNFVKSHPAVLIPDLQGFIDLAGHVQNFVQALHTNTLMEAHGYAHPPNGWTTSPGLSKR